MGKMTYEKLHNFFCPPNIIRVIKSRKMSWTRHDACLGGKRSIRKVLVGKHEGKRLLGRIEWEGVDWIHLTQYRDKQ
jgi:hypothetical protein